MSQKSPDHAIGLPLILFWIFLVLKLTNHIDWSWWWVFSPIWISILLGGVVAIIVAIKNGE